MPQSDFHGGGGDHHDGGAGHGAAGMNHLDGFFVDRAADHCDELTDENDDPILQLLAPFK